MFLFTCDVGSLFINNKTNRYFIIYAHTVFYTQQCTLPKQNRNITYKCISKGTASKYNITCICCGWFYL